MFGNRLGWAISAVFLLIVGAVLWEVAEAGKPSDPTEFGQKASSYTVELPIDPASVAPWMADSADASSLYQEAITIYLANPNDYNAVATNGVQASPEQVDNTAPAIDLLIKASKAKSSSIFSSKPDQVINYDVRLPRLNAIITLGNTVIQLGLRNNKTDPARAKTLYQAAFSLGVRLYEERLRFAEFDAAQRQLGDSANSLARLAVAESQTKLAESLQDFDQQRVKYYGALLNSVHANIGGAVEPHTGDMLALADKAGDPMWRVEAILALGRCKYSSDRFGDKQGAVVKLAELAESAEPRIRAAAIAAKNLTVEEFRRLR